MKSRTFYPVTLETVAGNETINVAIVLVLAQTDHDAQFIAGNRHAERAARRLGLLSYGPCRGIDSVEPDWSRGLPSTTRCRRRPSLTA